MLSFSSHSRKMPPLTNRNKKYALQPTTFRNGQSPKPKTLKAYFGKQATESDSSSSDSDSDSKKATSPPQEGGKDFKGDDDSGSDFAGDVSSSSSSEGQKKPAAKKAKTSSSSSPSSSSMKGRGEGQENEDPNEDCWCGIKNCDGKRPRHFCNHCKERFSCDNMKHTLVSGEVRAYKACPHKREFNAQTNPESNAKWNPINNPINNPVNNEVTR